MQHPPIPAPPFRGGCLCGAVRYVYDAAPSAPIPNGTYTCEKGPADRAELVAAFDRVYGQGRGAP